MKEQDICRIQRSGHGRKALPPPKLAVRTLSSAPDRGDGMNGTPNNREGRRVKTREH